MFRKMVAGVIMGVLFFLYPEWWQGRWGARERVDSRPVEAGMRTTEP